MRQTTITKDDFSSINLTEILNDTKYFHDHSFKFADLCEENFRKKFKSEQSVLFTKKCLLYGFKTWKPK